MIRTAHRLTPALILASLTIAGCGNRNSPEPQGSAEPQNSAESQRPSEPQKDNLSKAAIAHESPPSSAIEREVHDWAQKEFRQMEAASPYLTCELKTGESRDHQVIFQDGRCFKALAVADDSVAELDLEVYDPNGSLSRQDTTRGSRASAGLRHPLCPSKAGSFRVRVKAAKGQGNVVLRVYQSAL